MDWTRSSDLEHDQGAEHGVARYARKLAPVNASVRHENENNGMLTRRMFDHTAHSGSSGDGLDRKRGLPCPYE